MALLLAVDILVLIALLVVPVELVAVRAVLKEAVVVLTLVVSLAVLRLIVRLLAVLFVAVSPVGPCHNESTVVQSASKTSSAPAFACPKCSRLCTSRFRLYSHQRTSDSGSRATNGHPRPDPLPS